MRSLRGWHPAADSELSTPVMYFQIAKASTIKQCYQPAGLTIAERTGRFLVERRQLDDLGNDFTHSEEPWIFGSTSPDRESESTARSEPVEQVGKRCRRIVKEHHAEARDESIVGRRS